MKLPNSRTDQPKNIVGPRIRRARLDFDPPLTQDQLSGRLAAKGLSLDRVAITKIECGNRAVFDFELPTIAEVLKVDLQWLITGKGNPRK